MRVSRQTWFWFLLLMVAVVAFFLRTYALERDLVFVYDQGRDALAVERILRGDLTLIGPTTGLFGVYLGPFFYYLLTPMYWIARGNPVTVMYILAGIASLAVIPIGYLTMRIAGKKAGLFASVVFACSFSSVLFGRWLSNPTPLPLFGLATLISLLFAFQTKKQFWFVATGILVGLCLQLEAANAFFYLPTIAVIILLESFRERSTIRLVTMIQQMVLLGLGFGITLIPQGLFEFKYGFLSTRGLLRAFQTTHDVTILESIPRRASLLYELYARGWFPRYEVLFVPLLTMTVLLGIFFRKRFWGNQVFRLVFLWFFIPSIFHLLYTGNHGNFWDYYIIAQHPVLFILISGVLWTFFSKKSAIFMGTILGIILLAVIGTNMREWSGFLTPYEERISVSLQLDAIHWMIERAGGQPFGLWVYTPSYQDDAYRYLVEYQAQRTGIRPVEHPENTKRMYLLVEDDPVFWRRRDAWIRDRVTEVGQEVDRKRFGAVEVFVIERAHD